MPEDLVKLSIDFFGSREPMRLGLATAEATMESVDHPAHYGGADNPYEHIKVVEALGLNYHLGNATKYIFRAGKKDATKAVEDLRKAAWYLNREIERLSK